MVKSTQDHNFRIFLLFSAVFLTGFALWAVNGVYTGYVTLDSPIIIGDNISLPSQEELMTQQIPLILTNQELLISIQQAPASAVDDSVWIAAEMNNSVFRINKTTNNLIANVTVGSNPLGLAVDQDSVWVTNKNSNTTSRVNKSTNSVIATIAVGYYPVGVAVDQDSAWVASLYDNNVSRINKSTNSVIANIAVGSFPKGVAVDSDSVWVVNGGSNTVSRINKSTNSVIATITVGLNPFGVAVDQDSVWVANNGENNVSRISKSTNTVVATVTIGGGPVGIAVDQDSVWVANLGNETVSRINKSTNTESAVISVGLSPYGLTIDQDSVWTALSFSGLIKRINKSTETVIATTTIGSFIVDVGDGTGFSYDFSFPIQITSNSTNLSSCENLNISNRTYTLTQDIVSSGSTCLTFAANNVTLDCQGFRITGTGGSGEYGVQLTDVSNGTVKNCKIRNFGIGIEMSGVGSGFHHILNNTIQDTGQGIHLNSGTGNVINNNIINGSIVGSSTTDAIFAQQSANNNFSNNILTRFPEAIRIYDSSPNNFFSGTQIINLTSPWSYIYGSGSNIVFENTSFVTADAMVHFPGSFNLIVDTTGIDHGAFDLRIQNDRVRIDTSTVCPVNMNYLNTSAEITFFNATSADGRVFIDRDDVGNAYEQCVSPECNNLSLVGNTFRFNVSHFTTYSWLNLSDPDSNPPLGFSGNFSSENGAIYNTPQGHAGAGSTCVALARNSPEIYAVGVIPNGNSCTNNPLIVKYDNNGNVMDLRNIADVGTGNQKTSIVIGNENIYTFGNNPPAFYQLNSTLDINASNYPLSIFNTYIRDFAVNENESFAYFLGETSSPSGMVQLFNLTDMSPVYYLNISNSRLSGGGSIIYDNVTNSVYAALSTNDSTNNLLIAKFTSNLTFIGSTTFSLSGIGLLATHIELADSGNIYVSGDWGGSNENSTVLILDSSLSLINSRTLQGEASALSIGTDGSVYVSTSQTVYNLYSNLSTYSCMNDTDFSYYSNSHGITDILAKNSSEVYLCGDRNNNPFRVTMQDLSTPGCSLEESTPVSSPSSGGGGGGGSSAAAPNVTVCQEDWQCEEVGACVDGKQSMKCVDNNACGTTTFKPGESKPCAAHTATPNVPAVPSPAPSTSMWTIVLALIAALMIVSVITMSSIVVAQKRKLAKQLDQVIDKANASLSMGDKASAVNNYKVLKEYFTKYQSKITKKDLLRLHGEAMKLYENLSR